MVGGAYAPQHRWRRSIQDARLPSSSQGYCYCSTHERPGTSSGPVKSLPKPDIIEVLAAAGWFFQHGSQGGLGGPVPLLRANFGIRGPDSQEGGKRLKIFTSPENQSFFRPAGPTNASQASLSHNPPNLPASRASKASGPPRAFLPKAASQELQDLQGFRAFSNHTTHS